MQRFSNILFVVESGVDSLSVLAVKPVGFVSPVTLKE